MEKLEAGETKYAEPCKPIDLDDGTRHDDHSSTVVHVPGDRYRPMNIEKYFKGQIEKSIELKYRRYSFEASDLLPKEDADSCVITTG